MALDIANLQRYDPERVIAPQPRAGPPPLPVVDHVTLCGVGNSGEAVTLRVQALGCSDGCTIPAFGLNDDALSPRPVPVRHPDGSLGTLELRERLVLGAQNPRDQMKQYPLLQVRYQRLLRGISVYDSHAGRGGHGYPPIAALDLDLNVDAVRAFIRRMLAHFNPAGAAAMGTGQTDLERLMERRRRQGQQAGQRKLVAVIAGGSGAMGQAGHQLVSYLIREVLAEQVMDNYDLIGFVLGPRAFTGLTPYVQANFHALLQGLDHLARKGQRRAYLGGWVIDRQTPPYDYVFAYDDPLLPAEGGQVTEAELDAFYDRAAVAIYLLLRGNVWQTIMGHFANSNPGGAPADGQPRFLCSVQAVLAGVDRVYLNELFAARLEAQVLEALSQALAA